MVRSYTMDSTDLYYLSKETDLYHFQLLFFSI